MTEVSLEDLPRMSPRDPDTHKGTCGRVLVIDTLRHYIERRFAVQAMDRTTYEILWDLEGIDRTVDGLAGLLEEADLVKFAKFKPDVAAGKRAIETAREDTECSREAAP